MFASTIYYKINLKMSKFKSCHCPKLGHISKLLTKFSQYQTFSVSGCIWVPGGAFFNTQYILEQYAIAPGICFAERVPTSLWTICAELHTYTWISAETSQEGIKCAKVKERVGMVLLF